MPRLPLDGIRIIDSTYVYAFPYAAGILADMGAEVIKVEGVGHIDPSRTFGGAYPDNTPGPDHWNRPAAYNQINRGKKSLTLDLSTGDGRDALRELVKVSDVLMENYTPRIMRRWGLDYPQLKKLKPDIIMASNTGYGHGDGPWSAYPAQATTQEASHGHCHVTGYRGGIPSMAGGSYVDYLACWAGVLGILGALRHRNRTGKGQWIDVGMYQLGCFFISEYILDFIANGRTGVRLGNRHPWRAPQGCYPCAGDDQWCVISVGADEEWAALSRVMGTPEMSDDPRFATGPQRMRHHDDLDTILAAWTSRLSKRQVTELLQGAGVPAAPVLDGEEVNLNPHLWARGFLEKVTYPPERAIGARAHMGRPYQFNKTPLRIRGPAPALGNANHQVIVDLLGYTDDQYQEMQELGAVGERPSTTHPVQNFSPEEFVRTGGWRRYVPDFKAKLGV